MTREEYLEKSKEMQLTINKLEQDLTQMKKDFINEHKQIKDELPVKVHVIHTEKYYVEEYDAFVVSFTTMEYKYYSTHDLDFQPYHGVVYPVLKKAKKDGTISRFEQDFPRWGTYKFWVIGKEDTVYEIDFGR